MLLCHFLPHELDERSQLDVGLQLLWIVLRIINQPCVNNADRHEPNRLAQVLVKPKLAAECLAVISENLSFAKEYS